MSEINKGIPDEANNFSSSKSEQSTEEDYLNTPEGKLLRELRDPINHSQETASSFMLESAQWLNDKAPRDEKGELVDKDARLLKALRDPRNHSMGTQSQYMFEVAERIESLTKPE